MAERLKIEGNFLIIFEDTNPSNEYVNAQRATVTPKYDPNDTVRFYVNAALVGDEVVEFDCTTIIDDRTGLVWASVAELKLFLSNNLGPTDPIPYSHYEERNDLIDDSLVTDGIWTTVTVPVPALFESSIVEIVILSGANNRTYGVREVGSSLDRFFMIDTDSTMTMTVRVDAASQIQLYASTAGAGTYTITAKLV